MGKINKEWHVAHKMPNPPAGGPTHEERIAWYAGHFKNCFCRTTPPDLLKEIKKRGETI